MSENMERELTVEELDRKMAEFNASLEKEQKAFIKTLSDMENDLKDESQDILEKLDRELEEEKDKFAEKMVDKNKDEAEDLLKDQNKMDSFLEKLENKLVLVPMIGEKLTDIPVLVSMIRSYVKKEYTDLPVATIIAAIASLLYFLSPVDAIADVIPVIGYLDDLAVLSWTLKMIHEDLNDYREWKEKRK